MNSPQKVIVKTYSGKEVTAMNTFRNDAAEMAKIHYYPTSQSFASGNTYGFSSYLLALILCAFVIGFVMLIYMVINDKKGLLSVTYEYRPDSPSIAQLNPFEKVCPMCAETVKAEAKICRFCGHKFEEQ